MNKQELLENYTMEQLADMVVKLNIASEMSSKHICKLENKINNLEEQNRRLQSRIDAYVNYILPRATKEAKELLDNHHYVGVRIVAIDEEKKNEERPYGSHYDLEDGKAIRFIGFEREEAELLFALICERITEKPMSLYPSDKLLQEVDEIKSLKDQLQRKETTINQIDDILNELFGVTHDIAKPDEFKEILKEKIENSKPISDFLPAEPIKVADMLISVEVEPREILENGEEAVFKTRKFYISELRQIAEHLLVYCNANVEGEE